MINAKNEVILDYGVFHYITVKKDSTGKKTLSINNGGSEFTLDGKLLKTNRIEKRNRNIVKEVEKNKYLLINELSGKKIFDTCSYFRPATHNKLYYLAIKNHTHWGIIDTSGKIIVPLEYQNFDDFIHEGKVYFIAMKKDLNQDKQLHETTKYVGSYLYDTQGRLIKYFPNQEVRAKDDYLQFTDFVSQKMALSRFDSSVIVPNLYKYVSFSVLKKAHIGFQVAVTKE